MARKKTAEAAVPAPEGPPPSGESDPLLLPEAPKAKAKFAKPDATVSDYVKFASETIHRRQLKGAPYNPRRLKQSARDKLRDNLKRVGLLEPPIWNKRTGNIVGGHQRLAILDSLHRSQDYLVPVCVVDLSDQEEREQNVFLNNSDAQGDWDLALMEKLIKEDHIDLSHAGLDASDVVEAFGAEILGGQSEKLEQLSASLKAAQEMYEKSKKASAKTDDADFYRVVVGPDKAAAEWLAEWLEMPGEIFLPMHVLRQKIEALQGAMPSPASPETSG